MRYGRENRFSATSIILQNEQPSEYVNASPPSCRAFAFKTACPHTLVFKNPPSQVGKNEPNARNTSGNGLPRSQSFCVMSRHLNASNAAPRTRTPNRPHLV